MLTCPACQREMARSIILTTLHTRKDGCRLAVELRRTLSELAREAIEAHKLSSLSSIAQSFAKAMRDLTELVPNAGERNRHPIVLVWLDKLNQVAGIRDVENESITKAWYLTEDLAHGSPNAREAS